MQTFCRSTLQVLSWFHFVIIILLSNSCDKNIGDSRTIEFAINEKEKIVEVPKINNIKQRLVLNPVKVNGLFIDFIVQDNFLISGNLFDPKLINLYSVKSGKLLNKMISRGAKADEGLSVANLIIEHNTKSKPKIWVYDITLSKLFKIDVEAALKDTVYQPEQQFRLGSELKNIVSPNVINDSLLLATTYSLDDSRYIYATPNEIIKKVGKLPEVIDNDWLLDRPNSKFPNKAFIFKAISVKHATNNKVAVFYSKTDRVEFYNNDQLVRTVVGQDGFGPIMKVTKLNNGFAVEETDKTRHAYLSVAYTKDYIYSLYSGGDEWKTTSDRILVFNWEGEFIRDIFLDRSVSRISIDSKQNILYCYDDKEKGIFSTRLNLN